MYLVQETWWMHKENTNFKYPCVFKTWSKFLGSTDCMSVHAHLPNSSITHCCCFADGEEFSEIHHILQWPIQWEETALALPHVQGTGTCVLYCTCLVADGLAQCSDTISASQSWGPLFNPQPGWGLNIFCDLLSQWSSLCFRSFRGQ